MYGKCSVQYSTHRESLQVVMVSGDNAGVKKVTDNTASVRLSCPTLSQPHNFLCFVNSDIADLGSTEPVRPLGHGPLLSALVYQKSLKTPSCCCTESKHVCSPHSSLSLFSFSWVAPYLPWDQWTVWPARQQEYQVDLWPPRGPDWSSELPVISGCLVGSPVCLRAVIVSCHLCS